MVSDESSVWAILVECFVQVGRSFVVYMFVDRGHFPTKPTSRPGPFFFHMLVPSLSHKLWPLPFVHAAAVQPFNSPKSHQHFGNYARIWTRRHHRRLCHRNAQARRKSCVLVVIESRFTDEQKVPSISAAILYIASLMPSLPARAPPMLQNQTLPS